MSVPVSPNAVKLNQENRQLAALNELQKVKELLTQYRIPEKPLSPLPTTCLDQKQWTENLDIYVQSLNELTKESFLKDTIRYYLINQGKIKERRVAFVFPSTNNIPVAMVMFFTEINDEASDTLLLEIDFNQKNLSETDTIDKLSKDKSLVKYFKSLYKQVECFFLGKPEYYPKELDEALQQAYKSAHQKPSTLIPQTNEGDLYRDALVGLIGGLLKFKHGGLRQAYRDTLKLIKENDTPLHKKLLQALNAALSYHALNYAITEEVQTGIFNPTFVDIHFIFHILSAYGITAQSRNPEKLLSWLQATCVTELKMVMEQYLATESYFAGKELHKVILSKFKALLQSRTINLPHENSADIDYFIGFLCRKNDLKNLVEWIEREQAAETGKLQKQFIEALEIMSNNKNQEFQEKIYDLLKNQSLLKYRALTQSLMQNKAEHNADEIPDLFFLLNFLQKKNDLEELATWLAHTLQAEKKLLRAQFANSFAKLKERGIGFYKEMTDFLLRVIKYERLTQVRTQLDKEYQKSTSDTSLLTHLLESDLEITTTLFRANPTVEEIQSASCQLLSDKFMYAFLIRQHSPKALLEWLETNCQETCKTLLAWRKEKEDQIKKAENSWSGKFKKVGRYLYNHSLISVGVELFSLTKPLVNHLSSRFLSTKHAERMVEAAGFTSGAYLTYLVSPMISLGQAILTSVATKKVVSYWNQVKLNFETAKVVSEPKYKQELSVWYPLVNFGLAVSESILTRKPQPMVSALTGSFLSYGTSGIAKTLPGLRTEPGQPPSEFQIHCHNVLSMAAYTSGSILSRYAMDNITFKIDAREVIKKKLLELYENGELRTWINTLDPENTILLNQDPILKSVETPEMITNPSLWFDSRNPMLVTFQAEQLKYEVLCHVPSNESLLCIAPKVLNSPSWLRKIL
jgi:hypothetical protein